MKLDNEGCIVDPVMTLDHPFSNINDLVTTGTKYFYAEGKPNLVKGDLVRMVDGALIA